MKPLCVYRLGWEICTIVMFLASPPELSAFVQEILPTDLDKKPHSNNYALCFPCSSGIIVILRSLLADFPRRRN